MLMIQTVHESLEWILNVTDNTACHSRWSLRLYGFEFNAALRAGIKTQVLDTLFRLRSLNEDTMPSDDDLPLVVGDAMDENRSYICVVNTNGDEIILRDARCDGLKKKSTLYEESAVKKAIDTYSKTASL